MIIKKINEGNRAPRGYGRAYFLFLENRYVTLPIPFNIIVGFLRKIWFSLKRGGNFNTGYDDGFAKGKAEGLDLGCRRIREVAQIITKSYGRNF